MGLNKRQISFLNRYAKSRWSYNPATGLVDVDGNFDCSDKYSKTLRGVKFGKVSGHFYCWNNNLTSLEGAPQEVGGDFDCQNNNLTSLKGAPQVVGKTFNCSGNNLTSLEGAPQEVGRHFYCWDNNLTSLEGAPQEVGGSFDCRVNKLTSLKGAPQKVGGNFNCKNYRCEYKLTSLEGAPQEVGRDFDCAGNNLTTLEGAPKKVGMDFNCRGNKLTSLEGAPQEVGGGFYCDAFKIEKDHWNPRGWLELRNKSWFKVMPGRNSRKLINTIISPKALNKEIQQDPAGMIMKLKDVWNDRSFKKIRDQLVFPKGYQDQANLVGDLGDVGF